MGVLSPAREPGTVADRIRRQSPAFARAERKVARALLIDYPLAGLEPLAVVAGRAGTSAPTVLRVVGKLGFSGYPDFQRTLRAELSARWSSPLDTMPLDAGPFASGAPASRPGEPAIGTGGTGGMVGTVLEAIRTTVTQDLGRIAAEPDLQEAAAMLTDHRRTLWTVAGRFSTVLAEYLALHLQLLRPGVRRVPLDPSGRHTALLDVRRRDVVVAFDYRRYQMDTVEFGARAVAQGARLVLFTDHLLSPLAADADVVISTTIDTGSPFVTMSPAMAAVEVVLVSVVDRLGTEPRGRMERYDELSTEVWSAHNSGSAGSRGTTPDPEGRR